MSKLDITKIKNTPVFICEEELLEHNLKILKRVKDEAGVSILLALKGFSMYATFDLVREYLDGCCASGLNEAKLAHEYFGKELHTYSPAFKATDLKKIAQISNHIIFNSISELTRHYESLPKNMSVGLRINPEISLSPVEIYNPCGLYSRLGTTIENFDSSVLEKIDGLHFHALCEQNVDALERVVESFEEKFGKYFKSLQWVNFGGGHHITRKDYDVEKLIAFLKEFKSRHSNLQLYLEPGEAIGWQTGTLVATVLDIVDNGVQTAILDTSAEAHMLDSVIMPYRPDVRGAREWGEKKYNYRLGGNTCLAGDIIGEYSFDRELHIGEKIIFEDMIHYTMVKTTTFNGINLPDIAILGKNGDLRVVKQFGYEEFKARI